MIPKVYEYAAIYRRTPVKQTFKFFCAHCVATFGKESDSLQGLLRNMPVNAGDGYLVQTLPWSPVIIPWYGDNEE